MVVAVQGRLRRHPEQPKVWAPLHAWRALGQLRAEAAVRPLVGYLRSMDESYDDYALEELPDVFGQIGPSAIPPLATYLADAALGTYVRGAAASGLTDIARQHPQARAGCVGLLSQQLSRADPEEVELNGVIVGSLLDLQAAEAAPAIEHAFATGAVDESFAGDWDNAQYELGLTDTPPTPRRYQPEWMSLPPGSPAPRRPRDKAKARAKARRKQAAKSRKRNRKRK